ncbi:MAG: hypothetical protein ACLRZH_11150 [Ruthenibacterium lactatiformans]
MITTKRAYEDLGATALSKPLRERVRGLKERRILREEALRRVEAALQQAVDTASRSGVSPQELRQMLNFYWREIRI